MSKPASRTPWIIAALSVAAVALVGLFVVLAAPQLIGLGQTATQEVRIGGPFTLTAHDGRQVSEKDFLGKPAIVFFGFTHCPDICPTTLFEITQLLDALGDDAARVNTLFISVDPERDDPELLATYLGSFHPTITGLTGTPEQVASAAKAYRAYYKKVPLEEDSYTVDHTTVVYLFDRRGAFVAPLNLRTDPAKAGENVRALL